VSGKVQLARYIYMTVAYIAQITVNGFSFMKEFHTWHLSIQAVDAKPRFARTGCNFAEKSHAISVRISLDVFSNVPVLHPRIDLQLRACSEYRRSGGHDILNERRRLS
jgi:hypothetical protein